MNSQHIQYFNGLQQETQKLHNEARVYDRQRRSEEEKLKNIRMTQLELEEKLRNIANDLGQEIRTKKIAEERNVRLKQVIASDHQSILQMTSELQGIDADETKQQRMFVKEMESLNNEIDFLLNQRENERLLRLLEGGTVKSLVDTKMTALMSESERANGADEAAVWTNITDGLTDILEAEEKVALALDERKELENLVKGLREKFAANNQNLGQTEIGGLEAKWGGKYAEFANDHMEAEGEEDGGANASSAVHMDLFYEPESCSGPVIDAHARGKVGYAS